MVTHDIILKETRNWVTNVVIGCKFCPFAANVVAEDKVYFKVLPAQRPKEILEELAWQMEQLTQTDAIETAILILSEGFKDFYRYLELLDLGNRLIKKLRQEGVYQLASFHPAYIFQGTNNDDPANYTNRSPYPIIQILRESSITSALGHYSDPEKIPQRNIEFARAKGLAYMKKLTEDCKSQF